MFKEINFELEFIKKNNILKFRIMNDNTLNTLSNLNIFTYKDTNKGQSSQMNTFKNYKSTPIKSNGGIKILADN